MAMVRKFLDLSTGHLTQVTRMTLDSLFNCEWDRRSDDGVHALARKMCGGATPTGWFVYARGEFEAGEIPADLRSCMLAAKRSRCDYILFDADAPLDPRLPVHEERLSP